MLTYDRLVGFVIERIENESGAISHPLGKTPRKTHSMMHCLMATVALIRWLKQEKRIIEIPQEDEIKKDVERKKWESPIRKGIWEAE